MPGPPKQFDRDEALDRAIDVFWRHGYDGTSYALLVDGVGVNRSSLYATFGDKAALFRQALMRYGERQMGMFMAALGGTGSPLARVREAMLAFVDAVIEDDNGGCMLVNALAEVGMDPQFADLLAGMRQRMIGLLSGAIARAVAAGELAEDAEVARVAELVLMLMQGLALACRQGATAEHLRGQVLLMMDLLAAKR